MIANINERIKKIEERKSATVDGALEEIKKLAASKSLLFSKDHALDCLVNLKIVAKETKHPKVGYFSAVLETLWQKVSSTDSQFKRYLSVLLGDKDQERVLEAITKVDKASKASSSGSANESKRPWQSPPSWGGRGMRQNRLENVQCYFCGNNGHYQNRCPVRGGRDMARQPTEEGPLIFRVKKLC